VLLLFSYRSEDVKKGRHARAAAELDVDEGHAHARVGPLSAAEATSLASACSAG